MGEAAAMAEARQAPAEQAVPAGLRQRRCIATRLVRPRESLVRFVIGPAGEPVPDLAARLPGRGFWLTPERAAVERAMRRNLFAQAAGRPVAVPADLADRLERLLVGRCIELLGLARRGGAAVAGFERVREWLLAGRAGLLLAARDGAEEGRRKLKGLAGALPLVELLSAAELARAFGRETVVHAAVAAGSFAGRLRVEAERLAGMRADGETDRR